MSKKRESTANFPLVGSKKGGGGGFKSKKTFFFKNWEHKSETGEVFLRYGVDLDEKFEDFEEIWTFPSLKNKNLDEKIKKAIEMLWLLAGVSYYKAHLAEKIEFANENFAQITKNQAEFIETVWYNGLGEFFFVNKLKPKRVLVPFARDFEDLKPKTPSAPFSKGEPNPQKQFLLPLGGGKDSLTSILLLGKAKVNFTTWTVNQTSKLALQIQEINKNHVAIKRKICPNLIKLNQNKEIYNGHVPVTMILSAAGVVSALAGGFSGLVLSNEHSASFGNVKIDRFEVNHQWSKSWEAEKAFSSYVKENICADFAYFSLLRNLTEAQIVKIFVELGWERFKTLFSSCNRNFHLPKASEKSTTPLAPLIKGEKSKKELFWCCDCPKCAFVWAILSPLVKKEDLISVFGENLFEKDALRNEFEALMGKTGTIKPLECVGTPEEVCESLEAAQQSGNWPEIADWVIPKFPKTKIQNEKEPHGIPAGLYERIFKDLA